MVTWLGVRSFVLRNIGFFAIIIAVTTGSLYYVQVRQESQRAACQAKYNAAFTKSLSLRSDSSNARLDALDALLTGFLSLIPSDTKTPLSADQQARNRIISIKLFQDYGNAVVENAKVRAANPLPAIPDCH